MALPAALATGSLILLTLQLLQCQALRTGAPAIACVNLRPFHGLNQPKPASASQFFVTQSSLGYAPGQNVTVDIATHSDQRYFRGFIIQAYDPISGQQVGHFLPNEQARPIDSCSAATHRNNQNKRHVSLTWLPPAPLGQQARPQPTSVELLAAPWMSLFQGASSSAGNRRRQLAEALPVNATGSAPEAANTQQLQQVRFRASIVVTYDEFYTGFESSDVSFEKFDYATSGSGMPATAAS